MQFFNALEDRNVDLVRTMLASGFPVTALTDGVSALFAATMNDDADMIAVLVDAGADVNFVEPSSQYGKQYETALNYACGNGMQRAIGALLDRGADPTIRSEIGGTAGHHLLGYAIASRRPPVEDVARILARLLDAGLSVDSKCFAGLSLLDHVLISHMPVSVLQLLLDRGANPTSRHRDDGSQVIHSATGRYRLDVISALLKHGVSIDECDGNGRTPIYFAQFPELIEDLAHLGANLDHADNKGETILHYLIGDDCTDKSAEQMITGLLELGASAHIADNSGETACQRLVRHAAAGNEFARSLHTAVLASDARKAMRSAMNATLPKSGVR